MDYPALGAVEATDSGGARPYHSSEEREGREPDGLRFDRERACRLWEAVSGAQPVGREEGESGGRVRGREPLAHLCVARGVAAARGKNAGQPPGLRSRPLAPGPPRTHPETPGLVHPIRPRHRGELLKIEAAARGESAPRVQMVKGLLTLRAARVSAPPSSPTRAQLLPSSWTVILHAFC